MNRAGSVTISQWYGSPDPGLIWIFHLVKISWVRWALWPAGGSSGTMGRLLISSCRWNAAISISFKLTKWANFEAVGSFPIKRVVTAISCQQKLEKGSAFLDVLLQKCQKKRNAGILCMLSRLLLMFKIIVKVKVSRVEYFFWKGSKNSTLWMSADGFHNFCCNFFCDENLE